MRICVVGAGYVGLVTGTCLAESGNDVVIVEIDPEKVEKLNRGETTIYEPGLDELLKRNLAEERLSFTTDLAEGVRHGLFIFIAVGTPSGENGKADLTAFFEVVDGIGRVMDGFRIVIDKSTVPVGTADAVQQRLAAITKHPFDVVSNPEFLKEGTAIDDFMHPDRIVIGCEYERATAFMKELYAPLVQTGNPIFIMDPRSAEMTKYAANAMLAARISFMNEIANLCERMNADVDDVRRAIGADQRIGQSFLFPGVGFGGSCFPKDIAALEAMGAENDLPMEIVTAVRSVNARQRDIFVRKVFDHFGDDLTGRTLAVWGLAFKPRTDDMREAPAVTIIERLLAAGAKVRAHDPEAGETARAVLDGRIDFCNINYDCLEGADALLVITEWNEFRHPDFEKIRSLLKTPVIFDGRNIYPRSKMKELGFTYYAM
ncbi:MAG TPA: UDP-glucose/GDP-mannose dehydrogenase family protein, partial [Planctomycetota bacterium]|nr:UDP-glucose/GDP-mannose dehydrogenase family protein [Planctomycetota bacterium]